MNQTIEHPDPAVFDVRRIPCRAKHPQIFERWAGLPVGGHFILVNDHDPVPLYYQFLALFPEAFSWEYEVDGPVEYRVRITRLRATDGNPPPLPPRRKSIASPDTTAELDLRGLEPPEPMLRVLERLEATPSGGSFLARTDLQPVHLLPELTARGASYTSEAHPHGGWATRITRG